MKKKISVTQIVRHIIQLAAFILFPGLFILAYSSIKGLAVSVIGGTFSLEANGAELALTVAIILITILFGRFFCGFLCSFGALGDLMYSLSGLILKKRPRIPGKADKILKYLKYIVLAALIVFGWIIGIQVSDSLDPWHVFGVYSNIQGWTSIAPALSVGGLLLLAIMIGSFFFERFFCRYLCPLGAVFTLISKIRIFRFARTNDKCVQCGLCDKKCSMGIEISKAEKVRSGECIDCLRCAEICPTKAITSNANPVIAGTATAALMTGLYYVGTVAVENIKPEINAKNIVEAARSSMFTDGVYRGSAPGYRGMTEVSVTVESGLITGIDVVSTNDDASFFNRAKNTVIAEIISAQSTDVSAVSGATFSSDGIINAVKNALNMDFVAEENPNKDFTLEQTPNSDKIDPPADSTESSQTNKSESADISSLADGVYSGTGSGFRGNTTVNVTVKNGAITDIDIISYRDDEKYFSRAASSVIDAIISSQTPSVKAVSGATYSSNGIMQAVSDALGISNTNPNSGSSNSFNNGHGGRNKTQGKGGIH